MDKKDVIVPFYDWSLADFTLYSNRLRIEFGITLQIGGHIVSGTTTSGADFLKYVGEYLSKTITDSGDRFQEVSDIIKDKYEEKARKIYPEISSQKSNEAKEEQLPGKPAFIHLKNVDIWTDSNSSPIPVEYWRGKLTSVDGWYIGRMSVEAR